MAHICPNCFEAAPLLFGRCPECDYDMIECIEKAMNGKYCNHSMSTRDKMIKDSKKINSRKSKQKK